MRLNRIQVTALLCTAAFSAGFAPSFFKDSALESRRRLSDLNVNWSKTEFLKSIDERDVVVVELFLKAGMNPNQVIVDDSHEISARTPLNLAVEKSDMRLVRLLVKHGADLNYGDDRNETPLMIASAGENQEEMLKFLLTQHLPVNRKNKSGATALHVAAEAANFQAVKLLVDAGADVNAFTYEGDTALHSAASFNKDARVLKLLVDKGANIQARDSDGNTALQIALSRRFVDKAKVLRQAGAT